MPKGMYDIPGRRKTWTQEERWRVEEMVCAGRSSAEIARALRRSENSVHVYLARNVKRKALRPLTARAVAAMLGVGCSKTIARWISAGWLVGRKGQRVGLDLMWVVDEDDVLSFLSSPDHWHRWTPDRIPNADLRAWATEARHEKYLTPGQVAARFCVVVGAVNDWIHKGELAARKYGNWWIPESALVGFVIPSERDRHGKTMRRFTTQEDAQLLAMVAAGRGWSATGRALGRHPAVVQTRHRLLARRVTEVAA